MASVDDLYQEIILDHHRHPRNFGRLEKASHSAAGNNPRCGDETHVHLLLADGCVVDARFSGQGCAISLASASMMTEAVIGKTPDAIGKLASQVLAALRCEGRDLDLQQHGDLVSLLGVRKFPARIKCATLPWHALLAALNGRDTVSTEPADQPPG